jgi:hypothetical protein
LEVNHPDALISADTDSARMNSQPSEVLGAESEMTITNVSEGSVVIPNAAPVKQLSVHDMACKFICESKRRMATIQSVDSMVGACSEIIHSVVNDLYEDFKALRSSPVDIAWDNLDAKFKASLDPFAGLKTAYQQTQHVKKLRVFVPSEEYSIGPLNHNQAFVIHRDGQFSKPQLQKVTGQFISIKSMLSALNEHTDLVKTSTAVVECEIPRMMKSFFDGKYWQGHELCGQKVIVLRLYGDDFEPANPLGSHRCMYKVGCVYYQLENLPPHLQSKIENIF